MEDTGRVQSLDRAVALVHAVADSAPLGETAAVLAQRCGLNRATAWRLLATLEHHGVLERDPASNRYTVGLTIDRWAAAAGVDGLVRRAHDTIAALSAQTGETANLAVPRQFGLTYVDEAVPSAVLSARWLGWQAPLHATSTGKAFLAGLAWEEVDTLLPEELTRYTDKTIVERERLRAELDVVRERGYGLSIGEMETNLYGVSAAVLDRRHRPMAVVSVWGPLTAETTPERFGELGALAVKAAAEVQGLVSANTG